MLNNVTGRFLIPFSRGGPAGWSYMYYSHRSGRQDSISYFLTFSFSTFADDPVNPAILPSCMVSKAELGTITIVEFCFKPS